MLTFEKISHFALACHCLVGSKLCSTNRKRSSVAFEIKQLYQTQQFGTTGRHQSNGFNYSHSLLSPSFLLPHFPPSDQKLSCFLCHGISRKFSYVL